MKCPVCTKIEKKDIIIKGVRVQDVDEHLFVFQMGKMFHVHGPTHKKDTIKKFIEKIAEESGLEIESD
jgi:hypothetical protein